MEKSKGTTLYLQVEKALQDFQTGVAKLKDQQSETDSLLTHGQQALEELVQQVAQVDALKEEVEQDLRLLERYQTSINSQITQHRETLDKKIYDLKTDLNVRRRELLDLINQMTDKVNANEHKQNQHFNRIKHQLDTNLEELKSVQKQQHKHRRTVAQWQSELNTRMAMLERRNRYLMASLGALLFIILLVYFFS